MNTPIRSSPLRSSLVADRRFSTLRVATILVTLVACFTLATIVAVHSNNRRSSTEAQSLTAWVTTSIEERLGSYAEILYGLRHSLEQDDIDRDHFNGEIDRLDVRSRLPGVQVLGAAHLVQSGDMDSYADDVAAEARASGLEYPDFDISAAGARDEHLFIDYIEPQVGNEQAFGLDFLSERNRRAAAELARDTDAPAATAPIVLVQETEEQLAFLLMLPFYAPDAPTSTLIERRAAFAGVVYAAFRMDDLIQGTLDASSRNGLVIGDTESGTRLYGDDPAGEWRSRSATSDEVSSIDAFGRRWTVVVDNDAPVLSTMERSVPIMIAAFGLLVIGLFLAIARAMRSTRDRAAALAVEMTEELNALTEATMEGIITVDQSGYVVGWNSGASRMFGLESDEIVGKPVATLVPEDEREVFNTDAQLVFNTHPDDAEFEFERAIELMGIRGDGEAFPVEMTLSNWTARDQQFTTAFIRDISDRVEAERELNETSELLVSVLGAATEMSLIATDCDGVITMFNAGAERMLGYDAEDVVGKATLAMFHDSLELFDRAVELGLERNADVLSAARLTDAAETSTWTYITRDGGRVPVELTRTPRYDSNGERIGAIGVAVDITSRLAAEADQQRLLDQQRQIVTKLTEVDRVKSDFVSTMSHELRTPLTSIIGYTELLTDDIRETGPNVRSGMVMMIERNAERLLHLVEDLLSLSQIESGLFRVKQQSCDSAEIIHSSHEAVALLARDRRIDIQLDLEADLPGIVGDPGQLERVFVNLLANAVKFSEDDALISVRAHVDDDLVVSVQDHGIGIPLDEQDQLFTRFFRSRTADEHAIQGTGLGLAIVASIVDRHNGTITVDSEEGVGTTVTVTLPIETSNIPSDSAEEAYA